jgi:pimeloyl-ACP methyl ester carboxylesterase
VGDGVAAVAGASDRRNADGFSETVGFDDSGLLRFTVTPDTASKATLVMASSLFAEFQRNYRRETLLARAAAGAGFASIRFHYRGVGNSLSSIAPDLDTITEDLNRVAASVDGPVILVGTRLGALAVARVRRTLDVPAVVWEPVIDGGRWVEEVLRAALAREVAQGSDVSADTIRRRWADEGVAFVLGETVPAGIVNQVGATGLAAEMGGNSPVLAVQMGRNDRIRPDVEKLRAELETNGVPTRVLAIVGRQTWWVNEGGDLFRPLERDEATTSLIEGILDFCRNAP